MSGLEMKYFVLKPAGHDVYARASRRAMVAYASAVLEADKALAERLTVWAAEEEVQAERRRRGRRKKGTILG